MLMIIMTNKRDLEHPIFPVYKHIIVVDLSAYAIVDVEPRDNKCGNQPFVAVTGKPTRSD